MRCTFVLAPEGQPGAFGLLFFVPRSGWLSSPAFDIGHSSEEGCLGNWKFSILNLQLLFNLNLSDWYHREYSILDIAF